MPIRPGYSHQTGTKNHHNRYSQVGQNRVISSTVLDQTQRKG